MVEMKDLIEENINNGKTILLVISLISSILIIILYMLYKNLGTLTHKLSFIIAISELFNIIPQLIRLENEIILNSCIIFSDCLTLLILFQFSIQIYNLVHKNEKSKTYIFIFFLISIFYSFLINLINNQISQVKELRLNLFETNSLITLIHPLIMTIISFINLFIIYKTTKYIYHLAKNDNLNGWKVFSIINDLTNYPFIGIINWIFLWIGYFFSFLNNHRITGIFYSLNEIFLCLRCFLLFLLFITSQKVFENIKTTINLILKPMNIKFEFEMKY